MKYFFLLITLVFLSCKEETKKTPDFVEKIIPSTDILYAKGFSVEKQPSGVTIIKITSPWPNAEAVFTYALIPKEKAASMTLNRDEYDAIVTVPITNVVVTSTTHIPVLEALGVEHTLVGFPDTKYISSQKTRKLISEGKVKELGQNETINTELLLALQPNLVVGFSIHNENKMYETIQRANIPVVYNGDWTEETPLGKAEWIKFFAPFYGLEKKADAIFQDITNNYLAAKELATKATNKPTVLSGAIYNDVWYLPGGKSWASKFIEDANASYIFKDTDDAGSLSLSWESVLDKGKKADYWISPSQFTSYKDMTANSLHYQQFDAFKHKKVYSFANTTGETGGLLYYELAPNRPDLVLKDLIHIFHPELIPEYTPTFFKPID
ncbi:ABC transporter substrate-binding protein [Cellulophaga baltica]|uniref:ABC transporter substrate-binding protein n=1 Tax=Cellulophaga baltica 18 TaxID=1348584 RepID=A0AAU8S1V1_9FLAO|nr:ABC transporter substrate-binding protein [Cellulophaga baltica]AIZ43289.1 ABC transporter substrate-binding protein [Cellulophaga baltica 18]WFO16258.1 ABC transporter substrate-binding protein [Cellulophaga baltica 4]